MRFAIKFGRSFAGTTPLPNRLSRNPEILHATSPSVCDPGMTSTSFIYRGGLKKWTPIKCALKSTENGSAIESIGMPLVFDAMTEPGLRCFSTSAKSLCLISRFSTTASMTKSQSFNFAISSAKLPIDINPAFLPSINGAGFSFFEASNNCETMRFLTFGDSRVSPFASSSAVSSRGAISSRSVGIPALERWAAIAAPIVPAPSTAAFLTVSVAGPMFVFPLSNAAASPVFVILRLFGQTCLVKCTDYN